MGRTALTIMSLLLFMYLICFYLGAIDNVLLEYTLQLSQKVEGKSSFTFSYMLDNLFNKGNEGITQLFTLLFTMISVMSTFIVAVGMVLGVFQRTDTIDKLFAVAITAFMLAIWSGLQQVTLKLYAVSSVLAIIFFIPITILSLIAILETWRNPLI